MTDSQKKIRILEEKLLIYEEKLKNAMIGYRGIVHESAVSEIKHDKVMVLRAIIDEIKIEIAKLKNT